MNCYGYALQLYYDGKLGAGGYYKQQPGMFGTPYFVYPKESPHVLMAKIEANAFIDAKVMGYTMTRYNLPSNGVPAQFSKNQRLIALVTGDYKSDGYSDYHWYMQHSDGTWSHKPGAHSVTNLSLTTKKVLTNSNINKYANEGMYTGGPIRYYLITKDAITDYPHGSNYPDYGSEAALSYKNYSYRAGDDFKTSCLIPSSCSFKAKFDYFDDYDFYYFTATWPGTYRITTSSGYDIDGQIWIKGSTTYSSYDRDSGDINNLKIFLTPGQTVYVKVWFIPKKDLITH